MTESFVEVYRAAHALDAKLMQVCLEEAGLEVQLQGELLQNALGDIPLGWATAPRLLVPESQAMPARELITAVQHEIAQRRLVEEGQQAEDRLSGDEESEDTKSL